MALSYGAKNLSSDEALAYGERISAWMDLERIHGSQVPAEAITEWLVSAMLHLANLLEEPILQAYAREVRIGYQTSEKERMRVVRDFLMLLE